MRESAERLMREYQDRAEDECDARIAYHQMMGDEEPARHWRGVKDLILALRRGERD